MQAQIKEKREVAKVTLLVRWNDGFAPRLLAIETGVLEHELFPPDVVSNVLMGRGEDAERLGSA
jgi:hypothetical protein